MLFDETLLEILPSFSNVKTPPRTLNELHNYFLNLKNGIENNEYSSQLIGLILFNFVSKEDIRDRKVTSRIFEDIVSSLFLGKTLDESSKPNPSIPKEIKDLDYLCDNLDWKISSDLSGNKREKADNEFGGYFLSLKTLKGKLYNDKIVVVDSDYNKELNIGSLSFRALLVGLLSDEQLSNIKDRKGGLGSKSQLIESIYKPLINSQKWNLFIERLDLYMKYVYSNCDILIVMKSGYVMDLFFISEQDFVDSLIDIAKNDYDKFFTIFYRWENNNLRLHYDKLLEKLETSKKLNKVRLEFNKIYQDSNFMNKIEKIKEHIKNCIANPKEV